MGGPGAAPNPAFGLSQDRENVVLLTCGGNAHEGSSAQSSRRDPRGPPDREIGSVMMHKRQSDCVANDDPASQFSVRTFEKERGFARGKRVRLTNREAVESLGWPVACHDSGVQTRCRFARR